MALLKIRDETGNIVEIPALRGPQGEKGEKGEKGDPGENGLDYSAAFRLPAYYAEYYPAKLAEARTLMDEAGSDGVAFIVFSDSHMELAGSAQNGGNSGKLAYHLLNDLGIQTVLFLGDAGSNSPQKTEALCIESLEAFNTMVKPLDGRICQILGNHDGAWGLPMDIDGDGTIETDEAYPYNLPRAKTFNRALQKNRFGIQKTFGPDGTYYYFDDFGSKTRFLMLNTNDKPYLTYENGAMKPEGNTMKDTMIRQQQVDWIIASLKSMPEGWDAIACTHHPLHQNTVAAGQYVRGIFKAFRDKGAYTAAYAGKYSTGGDASYTNLLITAIDSDGSVYNSTGWKEGMRLNSSAAATTGDYFLTGFIPCKAGDIIRIKDAILNPSGDNINIAYYNSSFTKVTGGGINAMTEGSTSSCGRDVVHDDNGYAVQWGVPNNDSIAYIRLTMNEITTNSIITVNEEIVDNPVVNIDALSVDVDFSDNKGGDFIALFDGHAHNDIHYKASSFLVDMVAIACDGRVSNCSYMLDETYQSRALGTVYEQVLDVVVVNKATRTIKTVRIGAGENRTISY